jgi:CHAT domain-containing protein/Tfp pilus assembly protein PilF
MSYAKMSLRNPACYPLKRKILFVCFALLFSTYGSIPSKAVGQNLAGAEHFETIYSQAQESKRSGDFVKALEYFERASLVAQKHKNEPGMVNCIIGQALIYLNMGKIRESNTAFSTAQSLAKKLNLKLAETWCASALRIAGYYHRGKRFRSAGDYKNSIKEFDLAISESEKIRSKEHELKCLRQLSLTYLEIPDLQRFFYLNKQALKIAESLNHRQEQCKCLTNIGLFYWKLDNFSEALSNYRRAYDLAISTGDRESQAGCLNNIGIVYFDLGEYEIAMENLSKALKIDKESGNSANIAEDLINIGESYRRRGLLTLNRGDLSLALRNFDESLILAKKINDLSAEIKILTDLGATYSHLENHQKALDYFFEGLKKATRINYVEAMGMILNNIGIVYSQLGNYEESTKYYQRAIDLALGISGGKILWEAYLEIADAYKEQGKWDAALENYRKSISVIENIRSGVNLEELRATYLGTEKRIDAYYNIIDLYIRLYHQSHDETYEAEAFNYLEKAKARSFLDSIEVSKLDLTEGIDQKLLNRETELMNDISRLHTKLLVPQLSPEQRDSISKALESCENQLDSLKGEIRKASPAYANLSYPTTITLAEAQRNLIDSGTVYFAYLLGRDSSYAFAITRDDLKIFPLPAKGEIQKLVQEHLRSITDPASKDFRFGYRLYECLVKPGLNPEARRIIIIPDDALYFLPFETLLEKEQGREWLVKEYDIAYVPSLSSLRELLERRRTGARKPQKDILAIGDPDFGASEIEGPTDAGPSLGQNPVPGFNTQFYRLKYSGQEVAEIASLFKPKKREVLVRDQATEDRLKAANLSDYKIVHFATHAVIDEKKPARSSIVLTLDQDPTEDGFLQMREVFNLRLRADLVTLSACETGLGRLVRGEGIDGLSRAFFYAGASSVLLSLWAINDQASFQLLERFYVHLRSGKSIMVALRKAKLEMIDSHVLDHPYYWASFIAKGETDLVIFPNELNRWIVATLSIVAGLAILLIIVNRDRSSHLAAKD